ncbi:MAG: hypothetical protein MJ099_00985 [Clostridia bacterium]|nr:hypothetical protein [Clostridia bacterium]
MKKALALLLAMLLAFALTAYAESDAVTLTFAEGFELSLPADWMRYPVDAADEAEGILYCFGTADAACLMYVRLQPTAIEDTEALREAVAAVDGLVLSSDTTAAAGDTFIVYTDESNDLSGSVILLGEDLLTFIFTPLSDSDHMLTAATILQSYAQIEAAA